MTDDFLSRVYDLASQAETDAFYSEWASSYDRELIANGYRSPARCAAALAQFVATDRPVLDVGCGTGLSGVALAQAGFTELFGQDVNADMVEIARRRNLYKTLSIADITDPFPFEPGTYDALAAIGVIGLGAAPPSFLDECLQALAVGGHLVLSYNDHVLEHEAYMSALDEALADGLAIEVFSEHGPHIEKLGSGSQVYVLRRT